MSRIHGENLPCGTSDAYCGGSHAPCSFAHAPSGFSREKWSGVLTFLLTLLGMSTGFGQEVVPDFARDVRPILASKCFHCHGPDDETREANLRLDQQSGMFGSGAGGAIVTPGDPDRSDLVKRILSHDDDVRMPPATSTRTLSDIQKQTLTAWVRNGAQWKEHWAFQAPVRGEVPPLPDGWAGAAVNEIDHFIAQELHNAGLTQAPQETVPVLIRRLYLDLIGIPPTIEEADTWIQRLAPAETESSSKSSSGVQTTVREQEYRALVEHLLGRPEYGERWARRWLDLARYADSNGYEKDRPRSIWPWRDWVIDSLNADLPFDQFTIEQLAGDLLPGATRLQVTATGFHRNTMLNEEGGIDPLEFRFHAMTDRVATTGTTWLGLTLGCVQCHTHKYDPISHREYYQLMAFLNNADEPQLAIDPSDLEEQIRRNREAAASLLRELPEKWPVETTDPFPLRVTSASSTGGEVLTIAEDGMITVSGALAEKTEYVVDLEIPEGVSSVFDTFQLMTLTSAGSGGPGRTPHGNFVLTEIQLSSITDNGDEVNLELFEGQATAEQEGYPVLLATDGNPATGWAINQAGRVPATAIATWSVRRPNEQQQQQQQQPDDVGRSQRLRVRLNQNYGGQHTIGQFRIIAGRRLTDAELVERRESAIRERFMSWVASMSRNAVAWTPLQPVDVKSNLPFPEVLPDSSVLMSGDTTKQDWYEVRFQSAAESITAIQLEALPDESLPAGGPGTTYYEGAAGDFFLNELEVKANGTLIPFRKATHSYARNQFGNTAVGAELTLDGDVQTGWSVFGATGKRQTAVFIPKQPLPAGSEISVRMTFGRHFASSLGRFRFQVTSETPAAGTGPEAGPELQAVALADEVLALMRRPMTQWTDSERATVFREFLLQVPELRTEASSIERLLERPSGASTLVMKERSQKNPRPTFIHHRGEYLQPKQRVEAGVPSALHAWPADAPRNRLGFAKWLVDRSNPLTARVTVNRQWAAFFGRGIVPTLDDFGVQGATPSHPGLLDWLAVTWMDDDHWSMKTLHRRIVLSQTYRQSAHRSEAAAQVDPENALLSYSPRYRLDAEVIRDSVLRAAGVMSTQRGGPPVFPPQPPGITEVAFGSPAWSVSEGEARYRRSIYTMIKRTAPFAMVLTFDGPSGESCVAKRTRSNSPLQALTLMNDVMFVDLARVAGQELSALRESTVMQGADAIQADRHTSTAIFRRTLTRTPDDIELQMLVDFVMAQRKAFEAEPARAAELTGETVQEASGQAQSEDKLQQQIEKAVWTALARAIFALDESVTRP